MSLERRLCGLTGWLNRDVDVRDNRGPIVLLARLLAAGTPEQVMSANIVDVNSDNWDAEVAQSTLPVLVDFWAPWCGPCLALTPTIEAVAAEYAGQIKVVKVNCDDNKPISERFGVRGIPHLVLLKGGEPADVVAGRTRTRIADEVETHLA